jgi:hypothetical protein
MAGLPATIPAANTARAARWIVFTKFPLMDFAHYDAKDGCVSRSGSQALARVPYGFVMRLGPARGGSCASIRGRLDWRGKKQCRRWRKVGSMRLLKGWTLLLAGSAGFLLGLLAAIGVAFDADIPLGGGFEVPQSLFISGMFIIAGGTLFANGLLTLDTKAKA